MRRFLASFLIILLGGFAAAGGLHVPTSGAASPDIATQVNRMVSGILGYARWPTPIETYRFCEAGELLYLRDDRDSLQRIFGRGLDIKLLGRDDSAQAAQCDVLYLGNLPPQSRHKFLGVALGKPILTIAENDSSCAGPSMFCIAVQGTEVDLLANLDAISRSTIRINPKVLQLVQRRQGQP